MRYIKPTLSLSQSEGNACRQEGSRTYAVLDRGDLAAGDLSQLSQQVQHLQRGHEEHEVGQGEQQRDLPVRVLVHVLADQHAVVLHLAEVAQDFHRWQRRGRGGLGGGDTNVSELNVSGNSGALHRRRCGDLTSHLEKSVSGHQAFGDCVKDKMSHPKVDRIQLELKRAKTLFKKKRLIYPQASSSASILKKERKIIPKEFHCYLF